MKILAADWDKAPQLERTRCAYTEKTEGWLLTRRTDVLKNTLMWERRRVLSYRRHACVRAKTNNSTWSRRPRQAHLHMSGLAWGTQTKPAIRVLVCWQAAMGGDVAWPSVGLSSRTGRGQKNKNKNAYARNECGRCSLALLSARQPAPVGFDCSELHLRKKMTLQTKWNCVRSKPDASIKIF